MRGQNYAQILHLVSLHREMFHDHYWYQNAIKNQEVLEKRVSRTHVFNYVQELNKEQKTRAIRVCELIKSSWEPRSIEGIENALRIQIQNVIQHPRKTRDPSRCNRFSMSSAAYRRYEETPERFATKLLSIEVQT